MFEKCSKRELGLKKTPFDFGGKLKCRNGFSNSTKVSFCKCKIVGFVQTEEWRIGRMRE